MVQQVALLIITDPLDQGFLTFFSPKSKKTRPWTPKVAMGTIGGPLNPYKRGLNGCNNLLFRSLRPPRPPPRAPG